MSRFGRVVENKKISSSIKIDKDYPSNTESYETIVEINSKDRYNGDPGSFNYNLLQYGKGTVKAFRVNKITIPYSYYNIREQLFTVSVDNGSAVLLTIPAGSYTYLTLINTLTNLINPSISNPLTITYNQNNNKFTMGIVSPHTFAINFTNILSSGTMVNYNLGRQLGFTNLVQPQSQIQISDIVANLNATINIYVSSSALTSYMNSYFQTNRSTIIQAVPIQVNSFSYIVWENLQQTMFKFDDNSISQMDFKLLDDYGNVMDFNGLNWTIELSLYSKFQN